MLSAIALMMLAQGPDLAKPVTFAGRAERAATLLPKLGTAVGVPLEAGPTVADEILVVAIQDVPLQKVMDRIARVASAEWKPTATGFRLSAAAGTREREATAERTQRLEDLRKLIAKQNEQRMKMFDDLPAEERQEMMKDITPEPCLQVLPFVDLAAIAELRSGDRIVFATQPNRMQRPIGGAAMPALQRIVQEHNDSVSDQVQTDFDDAEFPPEMRKMIEEAQKQKSIKLEGPMAKALFVAERNSLMGGAQLKLKIYDAKGNLAVNEFSYLYDGGAMGDEGAKPAAGTTKIELRKETLEYNKAFLSMGMGGFSGGSPSAEQWKMVSRPDLFEPLSFAATDRLYALAASKGRPLIASLPDSMMGGAMGMPEVSPTLETFAKELRDGRDARLLEDAEFILVKPARPTFAREVRADRAAIAKLIASTKENGAASLDELAAFALTNREPLSNELAAAFLINFVPGSFSTGMTGMVDWNMLRFYGLMTPGQRAVLSGNRIGLGTLTNEQRQVLSRMVYGASSKLQPKRPGEAPPGDDPFSIGFNMFASRDRDYLDEPTEALPQGIPNNGSLEVKVDQSSLFAPDGGNNPLARMMGVLGPEEVAMLRFMSDAMPAEAASFMPKLQKGRLGTRRELTFDFQFTPQLGMTQKLHDNRIPADAPAANYDALPADFEKRVQARIEALKKSPMASMRDFMNRRSAPPP